MGAVGFLFLALTLTSAGAQQPTPRGRLSRGEVAARLSAPALSGALADFDFSPGQMGHPRIFGGGDDFAGIVAAARAERRPAVAALADYLKRHSVHAISPVLVAQIGADDQKVRMASWWQQDRMLEGIVESAFVWYVTRDRWFLDEMRARMQLFGPKLLARKCSGDIAETRDYVWYFALGYDLAYSEMQQADRQLVRDVVTSCAGASLAGTPATVRAHPENGIAFNALGKFVGAMLVLRGDMPDAARWLDEDLPAYVASLSPWGGEDGGFANGSSYALWDAGESLLVWDLIDRVLRVPLYKKSWLESLGRFITYTLPPGTPAGAFGDGAEVKRTEEWARFGKAIAYRSGTPLANWYAGQLKGEDPARLTILLSPRGSSAPAAVPRTEPDSAMFASVGVAAMHSSLADPQRVSVLFKSSPFGSVNHSHADQNSFVLYAHGEVLAMDSGYYDSYNSPHWRGWYKQTKAHNAITFDGGQGQNLGAGGFGDRVHDGRIAHFSHSAAYDVVVGDAADAYGGDIGLARRTVVYVRPSTVVVVDQMAGEHARGWEWNLHTSVPLTGAPGGFKETVGRASMCGTVASNRELGLTSVAGYAPPPSIPAGPHYWNRFAYRQPSTDALFVSVLRVDCAGAAPKITFSGTGAKVIAGGMAMTVAADGVTVQGKAGSGAAP